MRPLKFSSETGSAPIEFLGFGVFLMIPVMLFSINIFQQQNDQFAAASIAEHGLRALTLNSDLRTDYLERTLGEIAADFHEPQTQVSWDFDCGGVVPCRAGGQLVQLRVRVKSAHSTAVSRWSE
jgi:hypothetical protein